MANRDKIDGLTDKQRFFAYEYLKDFNGAAAARRAGYSPGNAKHQAVALLKLPAVQAIIERGREDRQQHIEITQERILEELAAVAFANALDYHGITPDGDPYVNLKSLRIEPGDSDQVVQEKRARAAALAELQVDDYTEGRGEDARAVRRVKFKLYDKLRSLELLGKHLGIFVERHHVTLNKDPREMTDEELQAAISELDAGE